MKSTIPKVTIDEYFKKINYSFKKEKSYKKILEICKYTKTRAGPSEKKFKLRFGHEQPILIKAILDNSNAKNYFEIGTGAGCSAYIASIVKTIEKVITFDVIPFDHKRKTAIDYKEIKCSNKDIYEKINLTKNEKKKINFFPKDEKDNIVDISYFLKDKKNLNSFDVCFIDGNHTDEKTILNDFNVCLKLLSKNGIIIFDDYNDRKSYKVKKVVDNILKENPNIKATLIDFYGKIYYNKELDQRRKEKEGENYIVLLENLPVTLE